MNSASHPKVGIGVMLFREDKILLGKRKGSHGEGEYAFPGGHLDYMESFEKCAKRETKEECDIEIENVKFQFLANVKKYAPKHYVHIGLTATYKEGVVKVMEADKAEDWDWYSLDSLPSPLFEMCRIAIESYKTGEIYFDSE